MIERRKYQHARRLRFDRRVEENLVYVPLNEPEVAIYNYRQPELTLTGTVVYQDSTLTIIEKDQ